MLSRFFGAPAVLNQIRFVWNFVFVKFFSLSKKVCLLLSKKASVWFYYKKKKKRFCPQFLVECFYKNIYNLRIKMFYQNRGYNFVLYYLIFIWVKFHVTIMRFPQLANKLRMFLQKLTNKFFSLEKPPLIFHACYN